MKVKWKYEDVPEFLFRTQKGKEIIKNIDEKNILTDKIHLDYFSLLK